MPRGVRCAAYLLVAAMLPFGVGGAQQPERAAMRAAAIRTADVLRPGDVVRLRIWREPDLSGDFVVDENGVVTLPKVGPVRVAGAPADTVKAQLLTSYREYLTQPSIEVTPLRRVQVSGAVRNPGLYTVDATTTVVDAIALAGGVTREGRRDRVTLVRDGERRELPLLPNGSSGRSPLRSGDEVFVLERSWLSRNPGVVIGAASALASIIWATKRR